MVNKVYLLVRPSSPSFFSHSDFFLIMNAWPVYRFLSIWFETSYQHIKLITRHMVEIWLPSVVNFQAKFALVFRFGLKEAHLPFGCATLLRTLNNKTFLLILQV